MVFGNFCRNPKIVPVESWIYLTALTLLTWDSLIGGVIEAVFSVPRGDGAPSSTHVVASSYGLLACLLLLRTCAPQHPALTADLELERDCELAKSKSPSEQ